MPIKSSKPVIKGKTDTSPSNELSKREIEFLLLKMKSAQFIGAEFEQFYAVFSKLTNQLKDK